MQQESEEGSIITEEMDKPLEKMEVGGPTSIDVTDEQASIVGTLPTERQEEKVQEQVSLQQEPKISKRKQRRISSYLSNISNQVEKNGNQINKVTMMIQSLQRQKQTRSTTGVGSNQSQLQSVKQIKSQISQLQKQMTQIEKDIQRIRKPSGTRTTTEAKFKKLPSSSANNKPRSRKSKSLKSTNVRRGRNR